MCGSAFKNKGVQTMLDAVMMYLHLLTTWRASREPTLTTRAWSSSASRTPTSRSQVWLKMPPTPSWTPLLRSGLLWQVASGLIREEHAFWQKERISRIFQMHSNKQNPIDVLEAGDIGTVVGFKDIRTGDTLCDEKAPIVLESMSFPAPVIGIAIDKSQADMDNWARRCPSCLKRTPRSGSHRRGERPNGHLRHGWGARKC